MLVKWLGHASIFVQMKSFNILMDPWLGSDILGVCRRFPDPGPIDIRLPHPDYIILSHHHWDHVHIPTLQACDKRTPVIIPDNDQLKIILELLEFEQIHVLNPWDEFKIDAECTLIATPSKVPFAEMGICFVEQGHYILNLVDSIFDDQILHQLKRLLDEKYGHRFGICFSPYQSYDEMSMLMRKSSASTGVLPHQNARALQALSCDLVIPFADGLYYPGNPEMNSLSFLNHPFDFIDMIKSINPSQACMIGLVFDEWYLENFELKHVRSLNVETEELLSLYDDFRCLKSFSFQALEISSRDRENYYTCKAKLRDFLEDFSFDNMPKHVLQLLKNLEMCWDLVILGGPEEATKFLRIDFTDMSLRWAPFQHESNSWLKIGSALLLDLLASRELLSIAMQSNRIELGGSSKELAYRSLDVLWYLGFDDISRLKFYVPYQARQHLVGGLIENWN